MPAKTGSSLHHKFCWYSGCRGRVKYADFKCRVLVVSGIKFAGEAGCKGVVSNCIRGVSELKVSNYLCLSGYFDADLLEGHVDWHESLFGAVRMHDGNGYV
jgi:hypothetical protein